MKKTAFISIVKSQEEHDAYIKKVTETIPGLNILLKQEVDEHNASVDGFNEKLLSSDKTKEEKLLIKRVREYSVLDKFEFIFVAITEIKTTVLTERIIRVLPENDLEILAGEGSIFKLLNAARQMASGDVDVLFYLCACKLEDDSITPKLLQKRLMTLEAPLPIAFTGALGEEPEMEQSLSDVQKFTSVPKHLFEEKCVTEGGRIRNLDPKSVAFNKEAFDKAGGYLEGGEAPDVQLACRMQLMGYTCVVWND